MADKTCTNRKIALLAPLATTPIQPGSKVG